MESRTLLAANLLAPIVADQNFVVLSTSPNETFIGTVVASDPDADPPNLNPQVAYQFISGDTAAFKIDPNTGNIKVANGALLAGKIAPEVLTVKVTDKGAPELVSTASITIFVNHPPVFTKTNFVFKALPGPNGELGITKANDSDVGQFLKFSILVGNEAGIFSLDENSGQLSVVDLPAFNNLTFPVSLAVRVDDNSLRSGTDTALVTIVSPGPNTAPTVDPGQEFSLLSSAQKGAVVGTVAASDNDVGQSLTFSISDPDGGTADIGAFEISPDGVITVANTSLLNALPPDTVLKVQVKDNGIPSLDSVADVKIHVNHPPILNDATFQVTPSISENGLVGKVEAKDVPFSLGQVFNYFIIEGNDTGAFAIGKTSGEISVASKAAFENLAFPVVLQVEARDGDSKALGKDSAAITISLNRAPILESNKFYILSSAPEASVVGTVQTTDDLPGEPRTFRFLLGGDNNGAFTINNSGVISVANSSLLNTFGSTVHLTVLATGTSTPGSTQTEVEIHLNRAPVIDDATFHVMSTFGAGHPVDTITGHDSDPANTPEGTLSYFLIAGNSTGAFAINPTSGEITVANKLAFDALTFPVTLTVQVRDDGDPEKNAQGTDTALVTIILDGPPVATGQILFLMSQEPTSYHVGEPPVRFDPQATFRLGDGKTVSFDTAHLEVTIRNDLSGKLSVVSDHPGKNRISVAGRSILYGNTVIGIINRDATTPGKLVIDFKTATTAASIQALLRRIGFKGGEQATHRDVDFTFTGIPALAGHTTQPQRVDIVKKVRSKHQP